MILGTSLQRLLIPIYRTTIRKDADIMENPFRPAEKYPAPLIAITLVFSFIAIAFLALIDQNVYIEGCRSQFIVASLGSTAVLIYAVPKAPFSKPKNVFFGHIFSAIFAITVAIIFDMAGQLQDLNWICCGICVAGSILIMMMTGTIHPPAGATALACAISMITDYQFVIFPIAIGLLVMMAIAYGANYCKDKYVPEQE